MPGNKKTCAGTGRNCIGGGNSWDEVAGGLGAKGLAFCLRPGSQGRT